MIKEKIRYWWSEDKNWFCIEVNDGVSRSTVSLTPDEAASLSAAANLLRTPAGRPDRKAVARLIDPVAMEAGTRLGERLLTPGLQDRQIEARAKAEKIDALYPAVPSDAEWVSLDAKKPPVMRTVLFSCFVGDHFEYAVSGFLNTDGRLWNHANKAMAFDRDPTHWRALPPAPARGEEAQYARNRCSTAAPSSPSAEYVLVPREPTREMLTAYWDCVERFKSSPEFGMIELAKARWSALLTAAPRKAQEPKRDETDAQMLARLGDNAAAWAAEFRSTAKHLGYSDMDEGWLIGWFANAIVNGQEIVRRSLSPQAGVSVERKAWLIERSDTREILYMDWLANWVDDIESAMQFGREEDAENFNTLFNDEGPSVQFVEHMWCDGKPRPASREAAE